LVLLPLLTLSPPAASGAARPEGPAEWWLKDGRVSVSWVPSKGLIIAMRGPDGVRSYAKVGSYASGKPFDIDDASQVCLRSARSKSFSFSAHSSLETVMVMPNWTVSCKCRETMALQLYRWIKRTMTDACLSTRKSIGLPTTLKVGISGCSWFRPTKH